MLGRIIINADDFGLTNSVNKAIIDVFKAGNLTSATMMVNTPGFLNAVELAKKHPTLGVGLHFCLTEGKPLTSAKTLIDEEGCFLSRGTLIKQILKGKINQDDITAEFNAQLEKLVKSGIQLTHTDSHQHVMMIPFVFNAVIKVIKHNDLPVRIVEPKDFDFKLAVKRPKKFILQGVNKLMAKVNRKTSGIGTVSNQSLTSIHELNDLANFDKEDYLNLVNKFNAKDTLELMVHPYSPHKDLEDWYKGQYEDKRTFIDLCKKEYDVLSKERIFNNHQLITFKDI